MEVLLLKWESSGISLTVQVVLRSSCLLFWKTPVDLHWPYFTIFKLQISVLGKYVLMAPEMARKQDSFENVDVMQSPTRIWVPWK